MSTSASASKKTTSPRSQDVLGWLYARPVIAVIGRPNVGKSTLINRIVGARKAIVDDLPGVTRDRAYYAANWQGQSFTVMDTGGLVPAHELDDPFGGGINAQVMLALLEADAVILVVDGPAGILPMDDAVAQKIRESGKPCVVAANKIDSPEQLVYQHAFHEFGLGEPVAVSAMHGSGGIGKLLSTALKIVPCHPESQSPEAEASLPVRVAILGRPNVGKSSILNYLLGQDRAIVSPEAGTTRDALDAPLIIQRQDDEGNTVEQKMIIVDTAGIRRKSKVDYGIELFSVDRALKAMRQADVAILVLDAQSVAEDGVSDQDKKIASAVLEAGRCLILALNKWDLIGNKSPNLMKESEKRLRAELPHLNFAPCVFVSAKTGQRLNKLLDMAVNISENARRRMKTPLINQILLDAITMSAPPPVKSRQLKIRYATQVSTQPPTFVLFCNDAHLIRPAYQRYLEKQLRSRLHLEGTPIRLVFRGRDD
ncbi:MAG: ribosome biogenesis GTPase Der [Vampirovibrionales bacterium]|nr:ribosome biogenesis GTPase Der [Vampirovibrionales bacterium]